MRDEGRDGDGGKEGGGRRERGGGGREGSTLCMILPHNLTGGAPTLHPGHRRSPYTASWSYTSSRTITNIHLYHFFSMISLCERTTILSIRLGQTRYLYMEYVVEGKLSKT